MDLTNKRKINILEIKGNTRNTTLSEQFQNQISNHGKGEIDTPNTQIHDRSRSWLRTCTSIKSCGVKLVICQKECYISLLNFIKNITELTQ